jgi:hypothetical protein
MSRFRGPWPACQTDTYEQLKLDEIGYPFIRRLMPERALAVFNTSFSAASVVLSNSLVSTQSEQPSAP